MAGHDDTTDFIEIDASVPAGARAASELRWPSKRPLSRVPRFPAEHEESHGAPALGFKNELYWGDNLEVMGHLLGRYRGGVDLVYVDPPFASNADYTKTIRRRGDRGSASKFEETQYADVWSDDDYLQFMYERLTLLRELLAPTGSLFLHCDWHRSAQLRCILDELFGPASFRNEIVWHYYNKLQGNVGRFASNHDTILCYSKSTELTFNRLRELREKPVKQIKRVWDKAKGSIVNKKSEDGRVEYVESTHKTLDDVWRLPMLQPADRVELVGYPTQKPEALLERIILSASRPGDLVFDAFMGSGTTLAVAAKLGRRALGADVNLGAVHATTQRLLSIAERAAAGETPSIKNGLPAGGYEGEPPRLFYGGVDVYSVNARQRARRDAEQLGVALRNNQLVIERFLPPRLLEKLSNGVGSAEPWRELVDSVLIDFDYDGAILRPAVRDIPPRDTLVRGTYDVPRGSGVIRVKVTDLLSDVYETSVARE